MKNKFLKKFAKLSTLCVVLLLSVFLLCDLSPDANAAIVDSGTCGAQGDNLTWTLDDQGTLTISGTGAMCNWNDEGATPWFSEYLSIKKVVIGDSVTTIGDGAFYFCFYLTSVSIPDGVTTIGGGAFAHCASMTSLTIPDSVTTIGYSAFYNCTGLTSVTIPDSVTTIGEYAFSICTGLTTVTIGSGVTTIGNSVFDGCTKLTAVTIPDSVTTIGTYAFRDCTGLTSITIPDSVTSIELYAFSECTGLTSMYISDLKAWCEMEFVTYYSDEGYVKCGNPLVYVEKLYLNNRLITDLIIPDGVTTIGAGAFYGYDGLTSVVIPDSVTTIDYGAFVYCSGLTSITIPESVNNIGEYAFEECTDLKTVYYGGSVEQWKRISTHTGIDDSVTVICAKKTIQGTVSIIGTPVCGNILSVDTSLVLPAEATYTYQWFVNGTVVGTGSTYTTTQSDMGKDITVRLTATGAYDGVLTSVSVRVKAAVAAPVAPEVIYVTGSSVTLKAVTGCQYSMDGENWQSSATFTGVSFDDTLVFYQRYKETNTHYASPAATLKVQYDASVKFVGASLKLQDDLAINYKADKALFTSGGFTAPYVIFDINGAHTIVKDYTVSGNRFVFKFSNIAPNQMNDTISATLLATKNGVLYVGQTRTYSIAEYCYSMLELYSGDQYAELRTLLVDLLNYGAASQWYTGYKLDDIVNTRLTDTQRQWATAAEPALNSVLNRNYETVQNPSATWSGASLVLTDSIMVKLNLKIVSTEGITVRLRTQNQEWSIEAEDLVWAGNGVYYVYFDGLHAGQMRETIYATVYKDGKAISNTVTYSIESYAYQMYNGDDFDLADLVVAMMKYGDSAYAYIN